jgi:hypothetical protein
MKFTNIKKNRTISKRIGAITMAASIGFAPVSLLTFVDRPSVAAESEKQEEYKPAILNGSSVGFKSLFYKIYDEMTTPIEVSTKTTSSISTMASTTATTTTTTESTTTTEMTTTITEVTTTETEKTTEAETTTEVAATVEEVVEEPTEPVREYVAYKPSTHYIHRSTCRWFNSECYEIEDTEGLECRRCSECNPEMEIATEYVVPTPQQPATQPAVTNNDGGYYSLNFITEEERIYLCNVVGTEYGADWVSLYDKACVVATVMNRVRDGGWSNGKPSTIYNVLTAPYQYNPAYAVPYYRCNVTQSVIDSVEYYFQHQDEFPHYTAFCGDGKRNYFR